MNQVQVNVVKLKISQCLLAGHLDVLRAMESVPKFRHDEEVLPAYDTLVDRLADTLSHLYLVTVVTCSVEQSVSELDGVIDDVGAHIFWNLPKSKAKSGNLGLVWEVVIVEGCGSVLSLIDGFSIGLSCGEGSASFLAGSENIPRRRMRGVSMAELGTQIEQSSLNHINHFIHETTN